MLIKTKNRDALSEKDVTSEAIYQNRRMFLKLLGFTGLTASGYSALAKSKTSKKPPKTNKIKFKTNSKYTIKDPLRPLTKESDATGYNNFYEFSLGKTEVKEKVKKWKLADPWKIEVKDTEGKVKSHDLEGLIKKLGQEQRIYRFRCVEAWSMVLPWLGFPLASLIREIAPTTKAKYIKFQSFYDPQQAPNFKAQSHYPWPYTEGLRMDEAMNPLAFIATGLYGKALPKQNGAPVRLVVPWKYGFKNIKSIVKIEFTNQQPLGLWEQLAPKEYGFYANVNPKVHHPRWSQATEKPINGNLKWWEYFSNKAKRIPTLMFNGYEKEVAHLYKDLDLKKNY